MKEEYQIRYKRWRSFIPTAVLAFTGFMFPSIRPFSAVCFWAAGIWGFYAYFKYFSKESNKEYTLYRSETIKISKKEYDKNVKPKRKH